MGEKFLVSINDLTRNIKLEILTDCLKSLFIKY